MMDIHYGLEFWLVLATVITGIITLMWKFAMAGSDGTKQEPMLVEYAKSFFPVLLVVLLLRSFIVEPFRIPSGSMIPTLEIGDFVLVNKFSYGVRLPVINKKIIDVGDPQRGDVAVFKFPVNPKINFIKRVVGVPGDRIEWTSDKRLIINGKPVAEENLEPYPLSSLYGTNDVTHRRETLPSEGGTPAHNLILMPGMGKQGEWVVPVGHYFMMGDNRDNSQDSRSWGYMPEKYLVGKAMFVWMHWNWQTGGDGFEFSRIGSTMD